MLTFDRSDRSRTAACSGIGRSRHPDRDARKQSAETPSSCESLVHSRVEGFGRAAAAMAELRRALVAAVVGAGVIAGALAAVLLRSWHGVHRRPRVPITILSGFLGAGKVCCFCSFLLSVASRHFCGGVSRRALSLIVVVSLVGRLIYQDCDAIIDGIECLT